MSVDTVTHKRWGARSIAALIIFVIAALLTPIALVGHWGHRTVVDSERYIDTVGPLVAIPEVQDGIATAITDAVVAKVDTTTQVETLLDKLFPDSTFTSQLASPIAAGVNGLIGELVKRFVASDQFQAVWIDLNTAAQRGLMAILEGGQEGPVKLRGDDVVLDISSALAQVQQFLVDNGITAAANISLPQNDREVVLFSSPALGQIRFIYALTSPILQWLPLVVAALFALSIALARRRARIVVAGGIVLVGVSVLLTLALNVGEESFINQLSDTPFGPASQVFWTTLLSYLILGVQATFVLGVAVILAGWFGGRTSLARRLRGRIVIGLDELGDRMPRMRSLRHLVAGHAAGIRWGIYLVVGLLFLLTDVTSPTSVIWCAALAAGLVTVVQLLHEVPDPVTPAREPAPAVG